MFFLYHIYVCKYSDRWASKSASHCLIVGAVTLNTKEKCNSAEIGIVSFNYIALLI